MIILFNIGMDIKQWRILSQIRYSPVCTNMANISEVLSMLMIIKLVIIHFFKIMSHMIINVIMFELRFKRCTSGIYVI